MLGDMVLKPGDNPRQALPRHRERAAIIHAFTLEDLAEAAGVNYQSVRKAVAEGRILIEKKESGLPLKAAELRSIVSYVARNLALKGHALPEEQVLERLPKQLRGWWANRFPKFDLFSCQTPGCSELLFSSGLCAQHGGPRKPEIALGNDGSLLLLLAGQSYVPLARLITQAAGGEHTHHRDGNPWNNRMDNLETLSPDEHADRHNGGLLTAPVVKKQPPRKPLRSELGGMTKAELQKLLDEAYVKGLADGRKRRQEK